MKTISLAVALVFLSSLATWAQSYRTDGGAIITDRSLLLTPELKVVYLSLVEIRQSCEMEIYITSSEGVVYRSERLVMDKGIRFGERLSLWENNPNLFADTYWLYFQVVVKTENEWYYSGTQLPIGKAEMNRELYVSGFTERFPANMEAVMQIHGSFDTYEPTIVVLNDNYRVPSKLIRVLSTTLVEISTRRIPPQYLMRGKILVTVCQTSWCDSIQAKHR